MTHEELLKENEELKIKLSDATLELNNLKRIIFGTKREYIAEANSQRIDKQLSKSAETSKEFPKDILNFQGTYEDFKIDE